MQTKDLRHLPLIKLPEKKYDLKGQPLFEVAEITASGDAWRRYYRSGECIRNEKIAHVNGAREIQFYAYVFGVIDDGERRNLAYLLERYPNSNEGSLICFTKLADILNYRSIPLK